MTENLTPSAMRAALIKARKAGTVDGIEAAAPVGDKTVTKADREAMWAKVYRKPGSNDTAADEPTPSATVATGNPPRAAHRVANNIDRTAMWAKAIKEAKRNPLPDFDDD
ncbi:hypothetical protein B5K11_11735 [Rhizobium leguminosarum bv. trifolii]|uniref:hypothetical protein n=1 Tax=Rhizobium leguminosarum TaxID=384 RepID=UPI000E2EE0B0|nr:hypothetical protein [Rhizobium leguminosarum]RFB95574.1 hypothetical protein B5K11_11735 [Rhizobium leguminosarum bv. trifolii]